MNMVRIMFCPYCGKDVGVKHYHISWLIISFFTGWLFIYITYGILSKGRICRECNLRIYPKKVDD